MIFASRALPKDNLLQIRKSIKDAGKDTDKLVLIQRRVKQKLGVHVFPLSFYYPVSILNENNLSLMHEMLAQILRFALVIRTTPKVNTMAATWL